VSAPEKVQAVCLNGHPIRIYGGPYLVTKDKQLRVYGNDFTCGQCGAKCYGSTWTGTKLVDSEGQEIPR